MADTHAPVVYQVAVSLVHSDWSGKHRSQQIDIHYNSVGEFDLLVGTVLGHRRKYKNLTEDAPLTTSRLDPYQQYLKSPLRSKAV